MSQRGNIGFGNVQVDPAGFGFLSVSTIQGLVLHPKNLSSFHTLSKHMHEHWLVDNAAAEELQLLSNLHENCTWRPPTDPKGHIKEALIFKP
jgi:hypothetical protein